MNSTRSSLYESFLFGLEQSVRIFSYSIKQNWFVVKILEKILFNFFLFFIDFIELYIFSAHLPAFPLPFKPPMSSYFQFTQDILLFYLIRIRTYHYYIRIFKTWGHLKITSSFT